MPERAAPHDPASERVLVLGRGRVGESLHRAFAVAGVPHALRPSRPASAFAGDLPDADLVLLAVPDGAIAAATETVATVLGDAAPRTADAPRPALVHLSGGLGLDELRAAAARGCATGSLHPFLPFAGVREPDALVGATFGIEASDEVLAARLAALAETIGARPRRVPDEQRALYHLAAVTASAAVVALAAQATDLLTELGWPQDEALHALLPLLQGAVDNLAAEGLPGALTGPWRRGDAGTVARHLDAMRAADRPLTLAAHLALAREAVALARGTGLDEAGCARLRAVLGGAGS